MQKEREEREKAETNNEKGRKRKGERTTKIIRCVKIKQIFCIKKPFNISHH